MPAITRRKTHNLLPLLLPLLLAIAALFWAFGREPGADRSLPAAPIAHDGRLWVPRGPVMTLPDHAMRQIGRTTDREPLYAAVGGGGAAGAPPVYIRVSTDRYRQVELVRVD